MMRALILTAGLGLGACADLPPPGAATPGGGGRDGAAAAQPAPAKAKKVPRVTGPGPHSAIIDDSCMGGHCDPVKTP